MFCYKGYYKCSCAKYVLVKMLQLTLNYVRVRFYTPQAYRLTNNAATFDKMNTAKTMLTS
jgi:hypothetical protein